MPYPEDKESDESIVVLNKTKEENKSHQAKETAVLWLQRKFSVKNITMPNFLKGVGL